MLRDKKTGKLGYLLTTKDLNEYIIIDGEYKALARYGSLAKLNKDWEDYKLAKPPIKDKKKRKLIRDWAEINGIKVVSVCETFNAWGVKNIAKGEPGDKEYMLADILFRGEKPEKLEFGKEYTIPELCGKEEQ